ncbi:MAG: type II toxin-antitoxin system RelE/ParE family toxin [Candidatus Methylumidiphilus alinenensis]|uniref:Type II toxin-antitoxin system RelE/ParE family toxin n=1 Tax=Candidatus Methylumidiphilus alinenensis TaxID=2202197 RepID=A0A2W4SCW3_9GAMM|nr:MAG: type II toxin-antitoxin system RelE/ParE family toxin [Candidatus Methylumidiphilus alinenensis]
MFQIYWTEEAEQDLEFVLTYYLENASVQVVESVYARIKEQIENLNNFPERTRQGRVIGTREYVFKKLPYTAFSTSKSYLITCMKGQDIQLT